MTPSYKILLCGVSGQSPMLYGDVLNAVNAAADVFLYLKAQQLNDFVTSMFVSLANNIPVTLVDDEIEGQVNSEIGNTNAFEDKMTVSKTFSTVNDLLIAVRNSTSEITIFTSGTTGMPKRVIHTVASLTRMVRQGERYENDVWGFAYNATHMAGLQVFFQAIFNGNTLVDLFSKPKAEVLDFIELYSITHLSATPSFYRLLLPTLRIFNVVKRVSLGGEKSSQGLIDALKKVFPLASINNIYATTETGTLLHAEGEYFKIAETYKSLIKIDNNELCVHASLLGNFSEFSLNNNWYFTGDLIEYKDEAKLWFKFLMRKTEMINIGGNKVNPIEVEEQLLAIEDISAAKVYSRNNSVLGQLLMADVVNISNVLNEKKIRDLLSEKLADYKIPRKINFVNEISLTRTGKIKR